MVKALQHLLTNPGGWGPKVPELPFDVIGTKVSVKLEEGFL